MTAVVTKTNGRLTMLAMKAKRVAAITINQPKIISPTLELWKFKVGPLKFGILEAFVFVRRWLAAEK